jgi:hypothetical protein
MNCRKKSNALMLSQKVLRAHFRDLALRIGLHCVRNTVIEDYHAAGKLTDSEMAALNREVANKIYSFLEIAFNPRYDAVRRSAFEWLYAPQWDEPAFDESFSPMVRRIRQKAVLPAKGRDATNQEGIHGSRYAT